MEAAEASEEAGFPEAVASISPTAAAAAGAAVERVVSLADSSFLDNRTRKTTRTTSVRALETTPKTTCRQGRVAGMKKHHGGRPKPMLLPLHMTSDWTGCARLVLFSLRPSFFFLCRLRDCW